MLTLAVDLLLLFDDFFPYSPSFHIFSSASIHWVHWTRASASYPFRNRSGPWESCASSSSSSSEKGDKGNHKSHVLICPATFPFFFFKLSSAPHGALLCLRFTRSLSWFWLLPFQLIISFQDRKDCCSFVCSTLCLDNVLCLQSKTF